MLKSLTIKDIVLIKEVELELSPGLNIITGETGAGKSIIVNSIDYITGEKSSSENVKKGAKKGIIEVVFDLSEVDKGQLEESIKEKELILRREIYATGNSRNFINDTPCSLSDLKDIGKYLVDLHGQHQHQSLFYPENYPKYLDRFGKFTELTDSIRDGLKKFKDLYEIRKKLIIRKKEFESKKELYEFQLKEINNLNPSEEEELSLEKEIKLLENSEKLFELSGRIYSILYENDSSIIDGLNDILNDFKRLADIDNIFNNSTAELESTVIICREIADLLRKYKSNIEFNPERLENLRIRLREYDFLKKKYGRSVKDILEKRKELSKELNTDSNIDEEIDDISHKLKKLSVELIEKSGILSERRKKTKTEMEHVITEHLKLLGVKNAVFEIEIAKKEKVNNFDEEFEKINFIGDDGSDQISFRISTLKDVETKPLLKIASGGEISRIMLALKSALSEVDEIPVMVFDEIDNGISGRIAAIVGKELKNLSRKRQIICITHLPQIAVKGDTHFSITKLDTNEVTNSYVKQLNYDERIEEIAKLIGGEKISEINRLNAEEMLKEENG